MGSGNKSIILYCFMTVVTTVGLYYESGLGPSLLVLGIWIGIPVLIVYIYWCIDKEMEEKYRKNNKY